MSGWAFYRRVAGVEQSTLQVTDLELGDWLWSCLPGSPGGLWLSGVGELVEQSPVASKAKCGETTTDLESVIGITSFQTGVSWHFGSLNDQGPKIDLAQLV